MRFPAVPFEHLFRLSDESGMFEHAKLTEPRLEHGYCVDDVARGLIVTVRQPQPSADLQALASTYLRFVIDAQVSDGRFHNRRGVNLPWQDEASLEDCWGRALWGLGTVVGRAPGLAELALTHFDISAGRRSEWTRAMCFAALGAAEVLHARPGHVGARALLGDAADLIRSAGAERSWSWPEPRLRYANAVLPETLLAAGALLDDATALAEGLDLLGWLLDVETIGDHLSVTPVGGWSAGQPRPAFDQQPIEVAALADACGRAFDITGDPRWGDGVSRCVAWFLGSNDAHTPLLDPASGGCCDGLEPQGRNENQGAESTLAMISTLQQAHRLLVTAR
jgi:hypothetical protein